MARRRKVDAAKVIEAVESGLVSREIMDSYGLESPQSIPRRRRGRARKGESSGLEAAKIILGEVTISKRGSLALSRTLMAELGFRVNDAFIVRRTKAGLVLKPVHSGGE
ncbi:MAG: hypothetical protein AB1641_11035 [Thermodesulfobacteriota bacterium]